MKHVWTLILAVVAAIATVSQAQRSEGPPLQLVDKIAIPHVQGRIDHLAADAQGRRLFVAALGNNTLEVLDFSTGRWIRSIGGLQEPRGVCYVATFNRIFVTSGRDSTCRVFDGESFQLTQIIRLSEDSDNIRYDPIRRLIYIGYGQGALGIVDAGSGKHKGDIKLNGHPESFQLESLGPKIFVNIPDERQVVVIDRKRSAIMSKWEVNAQGNYSMAFDEGNHRLFVGCRHPATMFVFDTSSGKVITSVSIAGDADDIFYDAVRRRIYISCGEGFLHVIQQHSADQYQEIAKIQTAPGARTAVFVPEVNRLYLAVPHRGDQDAEIWTYEARR
ncbi:MAG: hypothetical protein HY644_02975 [Acidobacteria bacterium]|nr:hypothetical protein [Acidobacteriota bacterium]